MKTGPTILVIVLMVGLLTAAVFLISDSGSQGKKPHDWRPSYSPDSKQPYGTWVIRELLNRSPASMLKLSNEPLDKQLPDTGTGSSYLFIGTRMSLSEDDVDALDDFVYRGNIAFISTEVLPSDILCTFFDLCYGTPWEEYEEDSTVDLRLSSADFPGSTAYTLSYYYRNRKANRGWCYLEEVDSAWWRAIGTQNPWQPNFFEVPYGQGYLYIHTTPLSFTNIALLDSTLLDYDEKALSYLADGDIYWDKARRYSVAGTIDWPVDIQKSESMFAFILTRPALRWAWYLLIAMAAVYIVFRSKRSQRPIPVIEPNTNTSLEFVRTMGQLYRLQGDHRGLVEMQMHQFLAHVRFHYGLPVKEDDTDMIERISAKAKVPVNRIHRIFAMYSTLKTRDDISADDLREFHNIIQEFYASHSARQVTSNQ